MRNIKRIPRIITDDDLNKIIKAIKNNPYTYTPMGEYNRIRDKTIILLMYYCGLRPQEALKLRWEDVDFEKEIIYVIPYLNKERNDTPAILTEPAKKVISEYMKEIKELNVPLTDYIFSSIITGRPLNTDTFAKKFQRYLKDAGLCKFEYYDQNGRPRYSFNPYSLRHAFATKIYNKTDDLKAVQSLLRHKNLESSHLYVHLDIDKKKEIAQRVFKGR